MEILLIHRLKGLVMPEMMKASLDIAKSIQCNPGQVVPGGKCVSTYTARGKSMVVCVWDMPNLEAGMPLLEKMMMLGWDTEVIPVEKMEAALPKLEKAIAEM